MAIYLLSLFCDGKQHRCAGGREAKQKCASRRYDSMKQEHLPVHRGADWQIGANNARRKWNNCSCK
jgi:hypothetical protein